MDERREAETCTAD